MTIATAIGVGPGILAYAFAGAQLRAGIRDPAGAGRNAFVIAGLVTLVMVAIAVAPWGLKRLSNARN